MSFSTGIFHDTRLSSWSAGLLFFWPETEFIIIIIILIIIIMQILGIININFSMNDKEDFHLLFNGCVRPHSEYRVQVWSINQSIN